MIVNTKTLLQVADVTRRTLQTYEERDALAPLVRGGKRVSSQYSAVAVVAIAVAEAYRRTGAAPSLIFEVARFVAAQTRTELESAFRRGSTHLHIMPGCPTRLVPPPLHPDATREERLVLDTLNVEKTYRRVMAALGTPARPIPPFSSLMEADSTPESRAAATARARQHGIGQFSKLEAINRKRRSKE